jgi:hypothetical protein
MSGVEAKFLAAKTVFIITLWLLTVQKGTAFAAIFLDM